MKRLFLNRPAVRAFSLFGVCAALLVGGCATSVPQSSELAPRKTIEALEGPAGIPELRNIVEDEAAIVDITSPEEGVILIWLHSQREDYGTGPVLREIFEENLMVVVVRVTVDRGKAIYHSLEETPSLKTLAGVAIPPVGYNQLSPVAAGLSATLNQVFRERFNIEKSSNFLHIFWGQAVRLCETGGFTVQLKERDYVFRTPLTGCSDKRKKPTVAWDAPELLPKG